MPPVAPSPTTPTSPGGFSPADQAKFDSILQAHNYVPPVQPGSAAPVQNWRSLIKTTAAPSGPSLGELDAEQVKQGASKITSSITEGADKIAASPSIVPGSGESIVGGAKKEIQKTGDLLETGLGTAAGAVQAIFAPITSLFQGAANASGIHPMQALAQSDVGQKLAAWAKANPEVAKNLTDALTVGSAALGDAGGAANPLNTDLAGAADVAKGLSNDVHTGISKLLEAPAPTEAAVAPETASLTDKIRSYFAKDNVDPRLEASASRLDNPAGAYKEYSTQAKSAVSDVKADPPIATVGENIGNAYDSVVKMRRGVGQTMADELSKVKDVPVDITEPATKFISEVDSGIGKMTSFDKEMLGNYQSELKDLYSGQHPTVGQVDDFLSRVPREMDVTKAAKNITDVTNAERIIKGNLADIRNSLTSQPGVEGYATARNAYSNLSKFLDEGSTYLGVKTGAGDYARDVSVAKSAAESILGGGKKDWLAKLESLTGYKALDDATLAIQAMTDAGDKRGLSLFKTMGEGALSPTSLPFKIAQWGAKKIAGKIIGTPAEQTQAFLESLKAAGTQAVPK